MHVLIVDDHPLYIKGVQALLFELDSSIQTVGARTLAAAFQVAQTTPFDLVLLDLAMPGVSGLEALERATQALNGVSIIVVSADESPQKIWSAIEMGAAGYIPKDTDPSLTIQALQLVLARGVYIPPQALRQQYPPTVEHGNDKNGVPTLSPRQLSVLKGLLQGKSNKIIARDLDVAEGTVKAHLSAIYDALGVNTRLNAMIRAHELRLVDRFAELG